MNQASARSQPESTLQAVSALLPAKGHMPENPGGTSLASTLDSGVPPRAPKRIQFAYRNVTNGRNLANIVTTSNKGLRESQALAGDLLGLD